MTECLTVTIHSHTNERWMVTVNDSKLNVYAKNLEEAVLTGMRQHGWNRVDIIQTTPMVGRTIYAIVIADKKGTTRYDHRDTAAVRRRAQEAADRPRPRRQVSD